MVVPADLIADQLAIARDGEDIVIAAASSLGQLVVIRTRAGGEPLARTPVDLGRGIAMLQASARGFVALRDDMTIAAVDLHGARLGALAVNPGERIATLASRRGRVIALVAARRGVRARWIEDGPLAWGSESAVLPIDPSSGPGSVALAPDHERLAARAADGKSIIIVRLMDGRAAPVPPPAELHRRLFRPASRSCTTRRFPIDRSGLSTTARSPCSSPKTMRA
ncbi:MAG TPA: hypothetical protein VHW23_11620 [Kofleriaceae bacterium]|nr:hypothetical protein [Kofleriaceae bacterium]